MKIYRYISIALLFFLFAGYSLAQGPDLSPSKTFIGKVISEEETGLGPYPDVNIKNLSNGQDMYFDEVHN